MLQGVLSNWNQNVSLKATAFAVAFVFWFIMLGRQDITLSRELDVQVLLPPNLELGNQVPKQVTVEIAGPRISLKRFSSAQEAYTLNLAGLKIGYHQVKLSKEGLSLPVGVEFLGIRPKMVDVVVRQMEKEGALREAESRE